MPIVADLLRLNVRPRRDGKGNSEQQRSPCEHRTYILMFVYTGSINFER